MPAAQHTSKGYKTVTYGQVTANAALPAGRRHCHAATLAVIEWQSARRQPALRLSEAQCFQAAVQGAFADAQVRRQFPARAAEGGVHLGQRGAGAA